MQSENCQEARYGSETPPGNRTPPGEQDSVKMTLSRSPPKRAPPPHQFFPSFDFLSFWPAAGAAKNYLLSINREFSMFYKVFSSPLPPLFSSPSSPFPAGAPPVGSTGVHLGPLGFTGRISEGQVGMSPVSSSLALPLGC